MGSTHVRTHTYERAYVLTPFATLQKLFLFGKLIYILRTLYTHVIWSRLHVCLMCVLTIDGDVRVMREWNDTHTRSGISEPTHRQTDRQTDRQTHRHTDRQTEDLRSTWYVHTYASLWMAKGRKRRKKYFLGSGLVFAYLSSNSKYSVCLSVCLCVIPRLWLEWTFRLY